MAWGLSERMLWRNLSTVMAKVVTQPTFRMTMTKRTIPKRKQSFGAANPSSTKAWQTTKITSLTMKMTVALTKRRNRDASEMNSGRNGLSRVRMRPALRPQTRKYLRGHNTMRSYEIFRKSSKGCRVEKKNCQRRSARSCRRVLSWSERSSSKSASTSSNARANT